MSRTLRQDIYRLGALGCPIKQVKQLDLDLLAALYYLCIYQVNYLCNQNLNASIDYSVNLQDRGVVYNFLRKKYLYQLKALSLCRSLLEGVLAIVKLNVLAQVTTKAATLYIIYANITQRRADTLSFIQLLQDARLFIIYYIQAIQNSPL